jgi:Pentapeptide repeats (9 copies)
VSTAKIKAEIQGLRGRLMQRWRTRRERAAQNALRLRPISLGLLSVAVLVVAVVTAVVTWWLYQIAGDDPGRKIDAIRTGLTAGAGTGGAFALLLAFLRQRSTEIIANETAMARDREQDQRERAAEATEQDAVERRITELYTKAADQLGSERAPLRLAGLYALERLAQNTGAQRQTIVNVLCAYLRMPFFSPHEEHPPVAGDEERNRYDRSRQERQVRLTAQCIVTLNLHHSSDDADGGGQLTTFWPNIDLDLTDAHLEDFNFANCHVRNARFAEARFSGEAIFSLTHFNGDATFERTRFNTTTNFNGAQFSKNVIFVGTLFGEDATFTRAQFDRTTTFDRTQFSQNATFSMVRFNGDATFSLAIFNGDTTFSGARFNGDATFNGVQFDETATFKGAQFNNEDATFTRAQFREDAIFAQARFNENAMFEEAQFGGDAMFEGVQFGGIVTFEGAQFSGNVTFDEARVLPPGPDIEHSWPLGWTTRRADTDAGEEPEWLYLTRDGGDERPGRPPRS